MVSKARLDLPEPERPVTTIRRSRGISREMFLRLWTRAPWTAMVVRAAGLPVIGWWLQRDVVKGEFLHLDVAVPGEADGSLGFAKEAFVGEVFAGGDHVSDAHIAAEVVADFGGGAGFADFTEMVDDWSEECGDTVADVLLGRYERGLDVLGRLPGVEQVGIDELEKCRVELDGLRQDFAAGELAGAQDFDAG